MEKAGRNAPLFIEAFYDAANSLPDQFPAFSSIAIPDAARINRILFEREAGYEIAPARLVQS